MKNVFTILLVTLLATGVYAQTPQRMSYQAVIRDNSNNLVQSTIVGIQISILQGSTSGTAVYTETQAPSSNAFGLISIKIGDGTVVTGDFSTIDWSNGPYFINTEIDPAGGTNYTITGTSQILSVPYALYAKEAENVFSGSYSDLTGTPNIKNSPWATNGSNIHYSSGNVGVGTISPTTLIHAHGPPVPGRGQISLSSPDGEGTFISFYDTTAFKSYVWYNVTDEDFRIQNFTSGDLNLNPYGGNVGIGTNSPNATLEVAGRVKITGGNPEAGKVLTSDGNGLASWESPSINADLASKAYVDSIKQVLKQELFEEISMGLNSYFKDVDGNVYKYVKIGDQWWMAENLAVTRYADGTPIENITGDDNWAALGDYNTEIAYCWYNDDISYKDIYGALYTYAAATNGTPHNGTGHVQGVCPTGWHLPSDTEWKQLEMHIGLSQIEADDTGSRGTDEGTKLKAISGWNSDGNGTDNYGFSALPGGFRNDNHRGLFVDPGAFDGRSGWGYWWCSTEYDSTFSYLRELSLFKASVTRFHQGKLFGLSVRCVRDN